MTCCILRPDFKYNVRQRLYRMCSPGDAVELLRHVCVSDADADELVCTLTLEFEQCPATEFELASWASWRTVPGSVEDYATTTIFVSASAVKT